MDIKAASAAESTRRRFVTPDNVVLAADVAGNPSAPAVVLMHGGGQTRHSWSGAMRALLAQGYQVINYDARGHGESGWSPDGVYEFSTRAEDLRSVLANVGASVPVALVGASMGGITAMQAISDGLRPNALVLVDIVLRPERCGVERIRQFMRSHPNGFSSLEQAVEAVAAYNPGRPRSREPDGLMRNLRAGSDGRLYWHWDPRMVPVTLDADLAAMERLVAGMRMSPAVPTLLVRGLRSDVVSDASVADFRALLPTIEVFDVAAAGHMVAGDDNDSFNRATMQFLSRNFPSRQRTAAQ
jgi:pimeloyl-ACP methyl ester carboxylesterase